MYKIDSDGNVAGMWSNGVPGVSVATEVDATWLNAVQGELVNIVQTAGIALDKATSTQVLAALQKLFNPITAFYKRQLGLTNETTLAGFNGGTVYDVGQFQSHFGEIFESTVVSASNNRTILYSMVVSITGACTAHMDMVLTDDGCYMFVDGVDVGDNSGSAGSLTTFDVNFTVGTHVVQFLLNNTGGAQSQLVVSEWMSGLPITWLRAATA